MKKKIIAIILVITALLFTSCMTSVAEENIDEIEIVEEFDIVTIYEADIFKEVIFEANSAQDTIKRKERCKDFVPDTLWKIKNIESYEQLEQTQINIQAQQKQIDSLLKKKKI